MRLKYKFVITKVGDDMLAMTVGRDVAEFNGVVRLNETGAAIMKLLSSETTSGEIADAMEKEFDVPRDKLEADIERFTDSLREKGLLADE